MGFDNIILNLFQVFIDMIDQPATGFNSSDQLVGPVTSLRESREAYFNLKDYTTYFDPHYRVRLETVWNVFTRTS